jgi:septal ring factor EnvC (AmiA/AmiB activator)
MSIMFTRLTVRHFAVAIVLTLGIVTVVSAQTNTPLSAPNVSMAELLAEVRSLRAEVRRAADTSIRAQLLVARLQVQEQRINSLGRQLADVDRQLTDNEHARSALAGQLSMFDREEHKPSGDEREGFEQILRPLKAQLALLEKTSQDLKSQQTYFSGLVTDEQSRWTTFNALLDELARTVEAKR